MNPCSGILLTDLYQLTMVQVYVEQGMMDTAVFEFFVRRLPPKRGFLMAAGLEQVLDFLEQLHLSPAELEWLKQTGRFSRSCLDYLAALRFSGDVHAMREGTVFFPNEPILCVTAPLPQAQLIETRIMNLLNFQTLIASKAARSVLVAGGKPLIDFGLRRAHGAEAGLFAARASYLAGFTGTATVFAGMEYDIPIYGTMAHSFVQAHKDEITAFEHFALAQPENAVFLIDTYDTEAAAHKVVALAPSLRQRGITVKGVRLDSGDLADHARRVRRILDEGGLPHTQILASGNLDEYRLKALVESGAPIDTFAVGTAMTTSSDAPSLDCAYKLQEYAGRPCRKRSEGKATWPGRKQVYRQYRQDGRCDYDLVTTVQDNGTGDPLLHPMMTQGHRLVPPQKLMELRRWAATELTRLPDSLRNLECEHPYDVRISQPLQDLALAVDQFVP
ncbi:MAG TPA: nicotinate phosphoribosyltransferase [Nitrospiraceae bacterium]|nr:nicotinate phosphoribosyltransferase [Nitrospiraceae bacterium]